MTLIEMIMVLAIVGLGLTVAFVNLGGLTEEERLRNEVEGIAGVLQGCRNTAILWEEPCELVYDLSGGALWIHPPLDPKAPPPDPSQPRERALETRLRHGLKVDALLTSSRTVHTGGEMKMKATPAGALPPHILHLSHPSGRKWTVAAPAFALPTRILDGHSPWEEAIDTVEEAPE